MGDLSFFVNSEGGELELSLLPVISTGSERSEP